jgi:hypothetical protein
MRLQWQTRLHQVPLESWTFVVADDDPHALFLSHRPDSQHWRGFVIAGARRQDDLYSCRWSPDLFPEHFAQFVEAELAQAQERLLLILAQRIDRPVDAIYPARNGRPIEQRRLTNAQLYQVAALQPRRP